MGTNKSFHRSGISATTDYTDVTDKDNPPIRDIRVIRGSIFVMLLIRFTIANNTLPFQDREG